MNQAEMILNGAAVQSATADNAIATVTLAATQGVRHFIAGIDADYSVAVALIKTITLKFGATTVFVWRWDFSKGPFQRNFPVAVHGDYNQAVTVELEAAGNGGQTGRVGVWKATA
jgi:hypothetical protein